MKKKLKMNSEFDFATILQNGSFFAPFLQRHTCHWFNLTNRIRHSITLSMQMESEGNVWFDSTWEFDTRQMALRWLRTSQFLCRKTLFSSIKFNVSPMRLGRRYSRFLARISMWRSKHYKIGTTVESGQSSRAIIVTIIPSISSITFDVHEIES